MGEARARVLPRIVIPGRQPSGSGIIGPAAFVRGLARTGRHET